MKPGYYWAHIQSQGTEYSKFEDYWEIVEVGFNDEIWCINCEGFVKAEELGIVEFGSRLKHERMILKQSCQMDPE